jgi:ABC-type sugar transport system substrate-binding protein
MRSRQIVGRRILSDYDQNTLGAVRALQAAGKKAGEVKLFNLGGDHSTFPLMKEGWIQGMMYLEPLEETGQGLEMLVAHLQGRKYPKFNDLGKDPTLPAKTVQITLKNMHLFKPEF